jgi:hypothetical protein
VIEVSLDGFAELAPQEDATQAAVAERLPELYRSGGRDVRRAVARLVSIGDLPIPLLGIARELLGAVAADRCYRVRTEVYEGQHSEGDPRTEP